MLDMIETKAKTWIIGKRYEFTDTRGKRYLCQVDAIQGAKVFAFVENMEAFNGWSYQRIDSVPTVKAAGKRKRFSCEPDCAWIELMRDDQLFPELQNDEFVRSEYLKVWIR
jgi:hypothetical protein